MSAFMADAVERPSSEAKRALFARLAARFGNRFSTGAALREQHANTLTWIATQPPDAVLFAETTPEVVEAVKLCAEAGIVKAYSLVPAKAQPTSRAIMGALKGAKRSR